MPQKYIYYEHGDDNPAGRSNGVSLIYSEEYNPNFRKDQPQWRFLGQTQKLTAETRTELFRKIHAGGTLYLDKGNGYREEVVGMERDRILMALSSTEWRRMESFR